jgi:hypothetical protein
MSVLTKSLMPGNTDKLLRGLNSLNVLKPYTLPVNSPIMAVTTTIKSSQFQASLK